MHQVVEALLQSLSYGAADDKVKNESDSGPVNRLARVYEIARNALEYRADHLVRRAAIERILRRQLVFSGSSQDLAQQLFTELKWAMYVTEVDEETLTRAEIEHILARYIGVLKGNKVNKDWLIGLVSAEIEDKLNPNNDYHKFTPFVYHAIKRRIDVKELKNLDLVLYVAVDKVFSQSDDQQISYHLYKLIRNQAEDKNDEEKILIETWGHLHAALTSPLLNRLMAFVRRQMGPLVLIRDIYFADPVNFHNIIEDKSVFYGRAVDVLNAQLNIMGSRIRTATVRSLSYVLLTKMLLVFLIEAPAERIFFGGVSWLTMGLNVLLPVVFMWGMVANVKLPEKAEQERLLLRAWELLTAFDNPIHESEIMTDLKEKSKLGYVVNYLFFGLLFFVIFALIVWLLALIHYTIASIIVFLFFLCIVSFFAYRIRQTALTYSYKPRVYGRSSFGEALMLPIVVVGGFLSTGVSKLNFMVFLFDFVLEAPFKIVLNLLDSWLAFLSKKRDEVVG